MKIQKIIFTFLILFAAFQFCLAQEKSKAILTQEFGESGCDELNSRIDHLFTDIHNEPNSKGYIFIYGDKNNPLEKYRYEMEFQKLIKFRKFPANLIIFLHGKDEENLRTQFWKVSYGGDRPNFIEEPWNYKLPENTKPFVVYNVASVSEVCLATYDIKFYSKLLLANPNLRGHLVIYDKSAKDFHHTEKELLQDLVRRNKVSRKQLKFFYLRRKKADVEFWLVPQKK